MKIKNIGGATAILENNGKRILFDPWLNDGIFHGAWYHYPPLHVKIEELGRFDYVYISHIHEDHCAAETIRYLNRDAEIILMNQQPNHVARFLEAHDFQFKKIHLIKPNTPTQISSEMEIDMLEGDPSNEMSHLIDSALILKWDNFVIYNANDCPQYEAALAYLTKRYPKIDLALLPYSGGSGYPACYVNLDHQGKLQEKNRIVSQRLKMFVDTIARLNPRYVMPFADQYVIAGSRSNLNQYISHASCPGIVASVLKGHGIDDKLVLLNSGQSFDFSTRMKDPDQPYHFYSEEDREEYVQTYLSTKPYEHESFRFAPTMPLDRLVRYARSRLWQSQQKEKYFPEFSYYLDVSDREELFHVPLNAEKHEQVMNGALLKQPYLRIRAPYTLMVMLLIGHVSWNIADAALFLDYERIPNRYDPKIHAFVNYLRI